MAETTPHKGLTGLDIHTIVRWVVADAASLPTNLEAADLHKVAYTQDTKTYYGLVSASPVEWRALGSSANPVVNLEVVESDLVVTFEDETTVALPLPSGGGGGGAAPVEILPQSVLTYYNVNDLSLLNTKAYVSEAGLHHLPLNTLRPSQLIATAVLDSGGSAIPEGSTLRLNKVSIKVAAQDGVSSALELNKFPIPPLDEVGGWRTDWFDYPLKDLVFPSPSSDEVQAGLALPPGRFGSVVYDEAGDYVDFGSPTADPTLYPLVAIIILCGIPDVYVVSARLHLEVPGYTAADIQSQGFMVAPSTSIAGAAINGNTGAMEPYEDNNSTISEEVNASNPNELIVTLDFPDQYKPAV